jgi:hypothetical protein
MSKEKTRAMLTLSVTVDVWMQTENCGNLAEGSVVNAVCNSTAMPSVKMKMVTKMLNGS